MSVILAGNKLIGKYCLLVFFFGFIFTLQKHVVHFRRIANHIYLFVHLDVTTLADVQSDDGHVSIRTVYNIPYLLTLNTGLGPSLKL